MKEMSLEEMKNRKREICKRIALVAAKRFCVFRMLRLHRLLKRMEALDKVSVSLA